MDPRLRFLMALRNLYNKGAVKTINEAMDFAKREFGEINDLFKRQIEQVFKRPIDKTPKPGEGGITSIKNAPKKKDETAQASGSIMDQIEASKNKIEGASNRITEIQKEIDAMYKPKPETSPLMQRPEKGIETLKTMKQPGMDLTVGLTRTAARKILDRSGIQVPDKVDPIDFFVQEFGADALMDVKNVAEEMIEIERMGKATKSIDEILEQTGMFNIKRDPNAPKGISNEELERIKKEVDQEKLLKDFDTTDRTENSYGGINRVGYKIGSGKSLIKFLKGKDNLVKKIKQSVEDIFTTDDIKYDADVAVDNMFEELGVDRDMFDQKEVLDAYGLAYDTITRNKGLASGKVPGSKPIKQGDEITSENFGESQFAPDISGLEKARELAPKM